ncbi:MAG TPA: LuxR C-terminal-related transcriptional regulator [Anaerolineales bacterium]|nr:LuxR C-terminal-related transcriptional regulator [Anaerolineales bacterium]
MNILKSKIQIPIHSRKLVSRPRLRDVLEREVAHHKLTLISAPAGFGKTTLLSDWAISSKSPIAWLSIDGEENTVEYFLRYLLAAWETIQPNIMETSLSILLESQKPDIKSVLYAFINAMVDTPHPVIFVLDDYHLVEEADVHEALTFLLDHAPPNLHFVLTSRGEPPLPLARYRARDEVLELHADDLRFMHEETKTFLNERMNLALDSGQIESLQNQVDGWIAGLQLAALSVRQEPHKTSKQIISGKHRYISDYLNEEVLTNLPSPTQQFLLQTSILDRLCASLCDAVTNGENGQTMLETLEHDDLFLVPLDEKREWFQYHQIFKDFLYEQLIERHPALIPDLHHRAAQWYLEHELPDTAFQHAVNGNDLETVVEIFERHFIPKMLGGEIRLVQTWLDTIPDAWHASDPEFAFARAALSLMTGKFEDCIQYLEEVERLAVSRNKEIGRYQAKVTAMRCNIACFQNDLRLAESFANVALQTLPQDELNLRAGVYGALGDTYRRNGQWKDAKESYQKLLDFTDTDAFRIEAVHLYGALADLDLRQGHLQNAGKYWQQALSAIQKRENWGQYPLPLIGWVYIRLAELYYEWNKLAKAQDHLSQGLERAELGGDVQAMIAGYLIAARLKLIEGDFDKATEYLERARPNVERTQFPYWSGTFERVQLDLWLARNKLKVASSWADSKLKESTVESSADDKPTQLTIVRVLIIKGDNESLDRATTLLKGLLSIAEDEGRTGIQIEALALQAILRQKRGEDALAMTSLEHALRLARPEGYIRLFIDPGLPMGRLLQEAHARQVMPDYVNELLSVFDDVTSFESIRSTLPEPLTSREEDVLKRMVAGLTNQEIAKELVISAETVKKHTSHIYQKLGVHSRTEAAAKARELNLFS